MTRKQVVNRFRDYVENEPRKVVAANFGISDSYLSMILAGDKFPGPKLLRALGIEAVVTYREIAK